ncbi:FkbM family methyltransferase [Humitalea sp. 24SJ18S-53]|uniref:FkbM family methyltransferase n=1 Tax=Humitalea sp. 24SJ18S-53 TaxID=3422307 RepID=UPI003D66A1D6
MGPLSRMLGRAEPLTPLIPSAADSAPETPLMPLLSMEMLRNPPHRTWLEAAIRARCSAIPLGDDLLLCRILGRFKFHVDAKDEGLAPHLLLDGYWEYWVTEYICRNTEPGMVAADVGANAGYFTVLMGDLVGANGRVHSVEPGARSVRLLERNVAVNGFGGHTTIHPLAVGAEAGIAILRSTLAEPKNAYTVPPGYPAPRGVIEEQVKTAPLDDLMDVVDIMKIDVEGAEEQVWAGMQRLLGRSPRARILFEFNAGRCHDPAALLRDMAGRFTLRFLDFDSLTKPADVAVLLGNREDTMLVLEAGA